MSVTWNGGMDNMLTVLWDEGLSASKIGGRMTLALGEVITKNSVIGRAHRLRLPQRPHAVHAVGERPIRAVKSVSLPLLSMVEVQVERPVEDFAERLAACSVEPVVEPPVADQPPPAGPVRECAWMLNDSYPWVSCDEPTLPGKPYCGDHCARAYLPNKKKPDARFTLGPDPSHVPA